ncbi:MAG: oligosaccharide flippase family protein [Hyphomicrobiaceae bacterium]|nr:oligosaccharide flippase family protein [Hyphomicrobiaceae bacterium]
MTGQETTAHGEAAFEGAARSDAGPTTLAAVGDRLTNLLAAVRGLVRAVREGADDRARAQRNAIVAFSVRVISAGLLYAMQIALARWMGTFEYGIYVFVWTWVLVLGGLSSLGLSMAAMRLVAEYKERADWQRLNGLTFGTRLVAFGVGTLVALAGAGAIWALEPHIATYYVLPAYLALVCIPLYALGDVLDGIGRGQAWMGLALVPVYILRPLVILAGMASAYGLGLPMTATTAAIAAIAATWLSALLQLVLTEWRLSRQSQAAGRQYDFALWIKASAPLLIIYLCELLMQNADVLIISSILSPTDVAIYFAAAKTMSLIMFVHYAVGSAVANRFSALNARGDTSGLDAVVRDAVRWTFWPSLLAGIVILALGKPLLWLFGPQFVDGYPVMLILVFGFLAKAAIGPVETLLNMLGEQARCAGVLVFTAALNVTLNLILVPQLGIMGGAVSTAAALVVSAVLLHILARQRLGLSIAIWSVRRL